MKTRISRYMCLLLRHKPEQGDLYIDEYGYTDIDDLVEAVRLKYPKFNKRMLKEIVAEDDKGRYGYDETGFKVRCVYGHSFEIRPGEAVKPPEVLYHGSAEKYADSIKRDGILSKGRQFVHLTADYDLAVQTGARHGAPAVFTVSAAKANAAGHPFYHPNDKIWLTDFVPVEFISKK